MLKNNSQVSAVLEKSKETTLQFSKGTAKVLQLIETVQYSKKNC